MKRLLLYTTLLLISVNMLAQKGIGLGLKAGINFANVTGASSISPSGKSGFHAGIFLSPASKKILGFRTELIYSEQGYDFKKGTTNGTVDLKYLMLPQMTTINITKYVQLQLGAQISFLLNASADSTATNGMAGPYSKVLDYYNKMDYGFAAGAEIHPFKGMLIGARYNISLNNLYKDPGTGNPSFVPSTSNIDFKNNLVQVFAGWRF
ncbi:MAG: porin family protein [Ferruginibacter sp.]